jgi:arylesterase/paraoxonase
LIVLVFTLKTAFDAGELKILRPTGPQNCRLIEGLASSEDIVLDRERGLAFISSEDRRNNKDSQGAIYLYDLNHGGETLTNLTTDIDFEFHPHGIDLYKTAAGPPILFVVNHRSSGHFVEKFQFSQDRLVHLQSFQDPLMHSPNDVAAVDDQRFYVTNDHRSLSDFSRTMEDFLQLARAYVLYYDGSSFGVAATGFAYPNGIALSLDRKRVYVAATIGRMITVYSRNESTGGLSTLFAIDAGTGVDNLDVDSEGNLWVGAHPKLLTFTRYMSDPTVLAPSEVLKITWFPINKFEKSQVFLDSGSRLSASSVATIFNDKLLVGSVADPGFLVCSLE